MTDGAKRASSLVAAFILVALALGPRTAFAKGCHEISDIVGYEHCTRYGNEWATDRVPRFFMGVELVHSELGLSGRSADVYGANRQDFATVDGSALGVRSLGTTGPRLRAGGYFLGPLYFGVGWGVGVGWDRFQPFMVNRMLVAPGGTPIGGGETWSTFLGLRLPLGRLSIRVEGDVSWAPLQVNTAKGELSLAPGVLETRALLDVWATPTVTMSLVGGIDAVHPDGPSCLGVSMEFHMRSFDGAFALW
jgi:hypothetical protein